MSIASELWLRDAIDTVEEVFRQVARNFTLRLAEKLAQYICSLTRLLLVVLPVFLLLSSPWLFPPLFGWSLVAFWPSSVLVPLSGSLGIWLLHVMVRLPCFIAWSVALHHSACVVVVLCTSALRYSS